MAEVVIPEVKHEYIRQVDTTETKDTWFDECIADNKEAAWAGIGTSENDSQYQPAPSVEPDYYMQYCSSDDYDYLKDYRLIWGYGIGIIEQDVICSLSTGEHLAEGKDACDTYATENAAGENTDWKRGVWIKFSGNRNQNPTRIGEVILPDRVISLKDLCAALTLENPCDFYLPKEEHVLNIQNLCGTKTNSPITLCLSDEAGMPFADAYNLSYAFAYTDARIWQFDTYGIDESYMFYHAKVGHIVIGASDVINNYTSKFEEAIGDGDSIIYPNVLDKAMFKNSTNLVIETTATTNCREDVSECFYGCSLYYDVTGINFSNARNVQNMFYNVDIVEDEITLDLSSFVEHDDDIEDRFSNFFYNNTGSKHIYNIIAPSIKLKGLDVFTIYNYSNNNYPTINITGELKYYDYNDLKQLAFILYNDVKYTYNYRCFGLIKTKNAVINGTLIGLHLIVSEQVNASNKLLNTDIDSNIILKTEKEEYTDEELSNIINYLIKILNYYNYYIPCALIGHNTDNNIYSNINIDDYVFVTNIAIPYICSNSNPSSYKNIDDSKTNSVIKTNKQIIITECYGYRNNLNITVNNNSDIIVLPFSNPANRDFNVNDAAYINLISDDNYKISCLNGLGNNIDEEELGIIINAEKGEIIFNKYNSRQEGRGLFDNLNIIDFDTASLTGGTSTTYNRTLIKVNKVNEVINSKHFYPLTSYGGGNIRLETNNTFIYNIKNNNKAPSLDIYSDTTFEYPIIKHNDELNFVPDYNYFYGPFNNTKLSDVIKRINGYENSKVIDLILYNQTNPIELCSRDIDEPIVLGNNDNGYVYYEVYFSLQSKNAEPNYIQDLTMYINSLYINKNINRGFSAANLTLINIYEYRPTIEIYNFIEPVSGGVGREATINITKPAETTVGVISDFKLLKSYKKFYINIETDINNILIEDVPDNMFMRIEKLVISSNNNILNTFDIKLLSEIDQESINSIVNPTNFTSGVTLTIHTTPFQYITEEQKQALVDAGVTLVEYIPTETTE